MKKSILIFCSLFLSFGLLAQEEETQVKSEEKQEVKLNLLMTVIGMPEISYEYFIEDNFTVGLSLGASVVDVEDFNYRFMATSYARLYFGKKNNAGFFLEGNVAYLNLKEKYWWSYYYQQGDEVYSDSGHSTKTTNNFGVGVAQRDSTNT